MFDIISLTEILNDYLIIIGFNLYRHDRTSDNHGGICVYAKQKNYLRRRHDFKLPNVECQWREVSTQHRKMLIGTFFI